MNESTRLKLAVIGAGPVGLALALHAAAALPRAEVTVFDARPLDKDVSGDPRTLALSLGTVQLLQRLGAWRAESAQPIAEVHVSQDAPSLLATLAPRLREPALTIRADRRGRADARRGAELRPGRRAVAGGVAGGAGARARATRQPLRHQRERAQEPRVAAGRRGRRRERSGRALRPRCRRRGRRLRGDAAAATSSPASAGRRCATTTARPRGSASPPSRTARAPAASPTSASRRTARPRCCR